jgi:glucosyl-dolichyl phosphate glucuronosyltransferase
MVFIMVEKIVSVVVCTYNRLDLLKKCLDSLVEQSVNKKNFEVLVIDNNSTDNTKKLTKKYVKKHNNFNYFLEKNQGLSYARNRGYKEAKGKYVAYIDDDAIADKKWVEEIILFTKRKSKINVFGGPYYRYSINKFPNWFPKNYGIHTLGNKEKIINISNEFISGSNMIFKKKILEKLNGFNINLGMKGSSIGYGEETNILFRLNKVNEKIFYVPKIKVKHLVADYKMSLIWLLKSNFGIGRTKNLMYDKHPSLIFLICGCFYYFFMFFFIFLKNYKKPLKNNLYISLFGFFIKLGELFSYFNNIFQNG